MAKLGWITSLVTRNFTMIIVAWIAPSLAATSNNTRNRTTDIKETKPVTCEWRDSEHIITYGPAIGCSICVIVGFFLITFGYKYRKMTLFLVGFSGGALLAYLICVVRSTLGSFHVLLITTAVAFFLGILCAVVVSFGFVASGLGAGISISLAFLLVFANFYEYDTLYIPVGVLIGAAVLMAGATVWWKRVFLIISTSVYGGVLIMGPLDYFVEDFWLLDYSWRKVFLVQYRGKPCLFSWIVLGIWPVLAIIGLMIQFLKTGKNPHKPKRAHGSLENLSTDGRTFEQRDQLFVDEVESMGLTLLPPQIPPWQPDRPLQHNTIERFNATLINLMEQIHNKHKAVPAYKTVSCERSPSQNEQPITDHEAGSLSLSSASGFTTAQDYTMAIKIHYDGNEIEGFELTSQENKCTVHFDTANASGTGGQASVKRYSRIFDHPLDAAKHVLLPHLCTCSAETQGLLEQMSRGLTLQMTNDGDIYVSRLCRAQVFCTNGVNEAIRLHREEESRVFDYQNDFLPKLYTSRIENSAPPSPDITVSLGRADGSLVAIIVTHAQAKKQVDQPLCSVERDVSDPNPGEQDQ